MPRLRLLCRSAAPLRPAARTVELFRAVHKRLGIVEEVTGRRRGRVFGYRGYLDILGEGTAPLPPGA